MKLKTLIVAIAAAFCALFATGSVVLTARAMLLKTFLKQAKMSTTLLQKNAALVF